MANHTVEIAPKYVIILAFIAGMIVQYLIESFILVDENAQPRYPGMLESEESVFSSATSTQTTSTTPQYIFGTERLDVKPPSKLDIRVFRNPHGPKAAWN